MGDTFVLVSRLLHQIPRNRIKINFIYEQKLGWICKSKACKHYEFGTKVTLATTTGEGFVVDVCPVWQSTR